MKDVVVLLEDGDWRLVEDMRFKETGVALEHKCPSEVWEKGDWKYYPYWRHWHDKNEITDGCIDDTGECCNVGGCEGVASRNLINAFKVMNELS